MPENRTYHYIYIYISSREILTKSGKISAKSEWICKNSNDSRRIYIKLAELYRNQRKYSQIAEVYTKLPKYADFLNRIIMNWQIQQRRGCFLSFFTVTNRMPPPSCLLLLSSVLSQYEHKSLALCLRPYGLIFPERSLCLLH